MKKVIIGLIALVAMGGKMDAQSTQKFTASKSDDYGLVYNLPITMLDIEIEAEHVVKKPGEFYKYAKKYLNIDDPIIETEESWTVTRVVVARHGVPDPEQQYLMQFKGGSVPFIIMDDANLPLAINTEELPLWEEPQWLEAVSAKPTPLETDAAHHVFSQEMLQSQSSAKRAELAAQQIYALRQSRTDLITGQADQMPPDGEAMQIVMNNIAAQEDALMAMFIGTVQKETMVKRISYKPGDDVVNHVIARLSAIDGIVPADDLSGDPVYLTLSVVERGKLPINEKTGQVKDFPKNGVAYCIPGRARVKISYGGEVFHESVFEAAQYGVVYGISPKLFTDKKAPAYMLFEPTTGALHELGSK